MLLSLRLLRTEYLPLANQLLIADDTGEYEEDTNPGGYGAPNPYRSSRALYLVGELMRADATGGEIVVGVPQNSTHTPLTATGWYLSPGRDGWVRCWLLSFAPEAPEEPINGNAYYDPALGRLRRYTETLDGGEWQDADPADYARNSAYARLDTALDSGLTGRYEQLLAELWERSVALYSDGVPDTYQNPNDQHLLRLLQVCKGLLTVAGIQWGRGAYYVFQEYCERLDTVQGEASYLLR